MLEYNLMDYPTRDAGKWTELVKIQWDATRAPGHVIGLFQKDKSGMSDRVKNPQAFIEWIKAGIGNSNIKYIKKRFYESHSIFDEKVQIENPNITLFVELGDDGIIDLGKNEMDSYSKSKIGVRFELENKHHNGFYLSIKYAGQDKDAIKIWTYSYEDFSALLLYLGLEITENKKQSIVASYKEAIEKAGSDCNKLDVIYETIPDFVISELSDETIFEHLSVLSECSMSNQVMKAIAGSNHDTDEELAALTMLHHMDKKFLYEKFFDNPVVALNLYRKIGGDNKKKLSQIFTSVASEYWNDKEDMLIKAYSKYDSYTNGYPNIFYILPQHTVYGKIEGEYIKLHGNYMHGTPVQVAHMPEESSFRPLDPVFLVFTEGGNSNECQSLCVPAVALLYMADEQFWDDVKKGSIDALQLFGVYGAVYSYVNATGKLIRTVAVLETLNETSRLFMNNPNIRAYFEQQPWGADFLTGYNAVSTGVDILSITTAVRTALINHSDDVRRVLRNNNVGDDALAEYDNIIQKAKNTNGTIVREHWDEYRNIFKANADEVVEAVAKIKNYRTTNNLKGGNFGYLEGNVNGRAVDSRMWRSIPIEDAEKEIHIFEAIKVAGRGGNEWLRITDSEYRMLNDLANNLRGRTGNVYPNITGELKIISENPYCISCQGIIQQFNEMFPNIKLILIDGAK